MPSVVVVVAVVIRAIGVVVAVVVQGGGHASCRSSHCVCCNLRCLRATCGCVLDACEFLAQLLQLDLQRQNGFGVPRLATFFLCSLTGLSFGRCSLTSAMSSSHAARQPASHHTLSGSRGCVQ